MGICRVCNNYIDTEHGHCVCGTCGYDVSRDYEAYLVLGEPVWEQSPASFFAKERDEKRLDALMKERMGPVVNQLYRQIEELKETLSARDALLRRKDQLLAEKDSLIELQRSTMNEMIQKIDALRRQNDVIGTRTQEAKRKAEKQQTARNMADRWRVGMVKYIGRYPYPQTEGGVREAISWRILEVDRENHRAYLMAEDILMEKSFHSRNVVVNWHNSELHDYMERLYRSNYFTDQERGAILIMPYETAPNPDSGQSSGGTVSGHITIPSFEEVEKYLHSQEQRMAKKSAYARNTYHEKGDYGWWWLRNSGNNGMSAMCVKSDGSINRRGNRVNDGSIGVRPAMWVDCDKL